MPTATAVERRWVVRHCYNKRRTHLSERRHCAAFLLGDVMTNLPQRAHPAFDNLTDEQLKAINEAAKEAVKLALNDLLITDDGEIEAIWDNAWSGYVSATGATFKFEVEVFMTPQPLTE
jgi:hypothetical protein